MSEVRLDTEALIRARFVRSATERARTRRMVADGNWKAVERDEGRAEDFADKRTRIRQTARGTIDFQPASFLEKGVQASRSVARVEVSLPDAIENGTGFMISPTLMLTNQHVVHNENEARQAQVIFFDELGADGRPLKTAAFKLAPDMFFVASDEVALDYALVAVGPLAQGAGKLSDFGFSPLSNTPDRHVVGMAVNIIQHPGGLPKQIVLRNNRLTARIEQVLHYETDTEKGSSGAPVFNDDWEVVALHHYGEPSPDLVGPDGQPPQINVNEGIRISEVFADIERRIKASEDLSMALPEGEARLTGAQIALAREALSLAQAAAPAGPVLKRRRRDGAPANSEARVETSAAAAMNDISNPAEAPVSEGNTQKIVIPLEITVSVGAAQGAAVTVASAGERKLTRRGAGEAARLDRDYTNRNGFNPNFVPGIKAKLSKILASLSAQAAPLLDENDDSGELKYQNFSVVMHKANNLAILTATNISGPDYIAINRETGRPAADQPGEGDSWYKERRIDEKYYLGEDFYKAWSTYFDRGHITRRNDPTWGTEDECRRANYDTFHLTNCSPQHWFFNESIKHWQGVERYVLERGLLNEHLDAKISVLQGPLFDGPDEFEADGQIVPTGFWKVIFWKGKNGHKTVALTVDQTRLLSMPRRHIGERPPPGTPVDVQEFRTSVRDLERRTGLDFSMLREFDTAAGDLPTVGEALQRLASLEQIPLD